MDRSASRRLVPVCAPFAAGVCVGLAVFLLSGARVPTAGDVGGPSTAVRLQGSKVMLAHDVKDLQAARANTAGTSPELNVPTKASSCSQPQPSATPAPQHKHCSRTVPLRGSWDMSSPDVKNWSFAATSCDSRPVAREDARACLAGRKIFGLGNSIVRQFVYELSGITDAAAVVPRIEQVGKCSKTAIGIPQRCMHAFGNGSEGYAAWFLYFNGWPGPTPAKPDAITPGWNQDTCGTLPLRDCLSVLLADARPSDILLTNVGIAYAIWDPQGVEDIPSWRQDEARVYVRILSEMFPGTIIYMPQSPMQSSQSKLEFPNRHFYERVERANEHIMPVILQESNWLVFDVWSFIKPVLYTKLFSDRIHFDGRATQIAWDILLRMICPDSLLTAQ